MVTTRLQGFTLVEIIIAVSILTIAARVAFGFDLSSLRRESIADVQNDFIAVLESARSQSLNNICDTSCTHGVHVQSNQYVEFQGNSYNPSDPQNFSHPLSAGTYFLATTDIVFQPTSGDATATTIVLCGENNFSTITIMSDGEMYE